MDTQLAQGVLFYCGTYVTVMLIMVSFLTGKLMYIFFIVLTLGLLFYVNYLIIENNSHLQNVGKWVEEMIKTYITRT